MVIADTPPIIPNRYHFVFGLRPRAEAFHLVHYLCLASCLEVNRPEAIYFHYGCEPYGRYWDLIRDRLTLVPIEPVPLVASHRYRERAVSRYRYAHHADFIRLERVVEHGGIYADIDTIFVHPAPEALRRQPFVLGREDDIYDPDTRAAGPSLCNAVIMAQPGAEFGRRWLAAMAGAFDGSWSRHSTLLPYRLSQEHPDLIHVEPSRTFYKHMWTRDGLHSLLEGCDPDTEGVVSMHLWAHLWWDWRRRDFSRFHAGQLTEEYIRSTDTTYTLAARPFLPAPKPARRGPLGALRRVWMRQ
jgi:hypothetical protein